MRWIGLLPVLLRTFGWKGLFRRGLHEIRCRFDLFLAVERHAVSPDKRKRLGNSSIYQPGEGYCRSTSGERKRICDRGRRVVDGWYQAYGHEWRRLPDTEIGWRTDPTNGYTFPTCGWWKIEHLPPEADIKDTWEPARFSWAYDLIRAYRATGDLAYAHTFHRLVESWQRANPSFTGVHWSCGQEVAIRSLAILFAANSLPAPEESASEKRILELLGWSGERIANAIGYGLSQRNNHGISEAAGLIHIGLSLRSAHPKAKAWIRLGRRLLEEQIRDQFSADGWYAQHSFTYMRVALEQILLVQRLLLGNGMTLSEASLDLAGKSYALLILLVDENTGFVPNYGANDGGRAAILSSAEYRDFRPLLTLAALVLEEELPSDIPPDPDVVAWFGGGAPATGQPRRDGVWSGTLGWAVARLGGINVFLRAGSYRHRPSQLDPLQIDVRFRRAEIVTDPGTYAYNGPQPWKNALASAIVHNGPILDDTEPGVRGPRFLWYSWPNSRLLEAVYRDNCVRLVAEMPGRVRRKIDLTRDEVRIVDSVLDPQVAKVQVTWTLHPTVSDTDLVKVENAERLQAVDGDITGWFSPTYGLRLPGIAIRSVRTRDDTGLECRTTITMPLLESGNPG